MELRGKNGFMLNCIGFIRIVAHSGYDVNAFSRFSLAFQFVLFGFHGVGIAVIAVFAGLFGPPWAAAGT